MKRIFTATLVAACSLFIASCSKDNTTPIYDSYSQLKTGNYWIYGIYSSDSSGTGGTPLGVYDSCYVSSDTVINGNTYYYLTSNNPLVGDMYNKWLRDSLSYIVDNYGRRYFSSEDFSSTLSQEPLFIGNPLNDTIAIVTQKMEFTYPSVSTPAGTFNTYDCKSTIFFLPPYDAAGQYRYKHRYHAKNIGIVSESIAFYFINPQYLERRLVRYHVN